MHANIANILCLVPEDRRKTYQIWNIVTYLILGIVDDLKPVLTIMPESPREFVPPDSLEDVRIVGCPQDFQCSIIEGIRTDSEFSFFILLFLIS
jgi:hypothetical protein